MAAATMSRPRSFRNLMGMGTYTEMQDDEYEEEIIEEEYIEEVISDDDDDYFEVVIEDDEPRRSSDDSNVASLNGRATQGQIDGLSLAEAKKFLSGLPGKKDTAQEVLEFDYNSDDDSLYEEYVLPDEITAIRGSRRNSIFAAPDLDLIEEGSERSLNTAATKNSVRSSLHSPTSTTRDEKKLRSLEAIQEQPGKNADTENNGVSKVPKIPVQIDIFSEQDQPKPKTPVEASDNPLPEGTILSGALNDTDEKDEIRIEKLGETKPREEAKKVPPTKPREEPKKTPAPPPPAVVEDSGDDVLPEGTILSGSLNDTDEKDDIRIEKMGAMMACPKSPGPAQPWSAKSIGSESTTTTAGTSSSSLGSTGMPPVSPGDESVNSKKRRGSRHNRTIKETIEKPSSSSSLGKHADGEGSSSSRGQRRSSGSRREGDDDNKSGHQRRPIERTRSGRRSKSNDAATKAAQTPGTPTKPKEESTAISMEDEIMQFLSQPVKVQGPNESANSLHLSNSDLNKSSSNVPAMTKSESHLSTINSELLSPTKRPPKYGDAKSVGGGSSRSSRRRSSASPSPKADGELGKFFASAPGETKKIDRDARSAYSSSRRSSRSGSSRMSSKSEPGAAPEKNGALGSFLTADQPDLPADYTDGRSIRRGGRRRDSQSVCGTESTRAPRRSSLTGSTPTESTRSPRRSSLTGSTPIPPVTKEEKEQKPTPAPAKVDFAPTPTPAPAPVPEKPKPKLGLGAFLAAMPDQPISKMDRDARSTFSGMGKRRQSRADRDCQSVVGDSTARRRSSSTHGRARGRGRRRSKKPESGAAPDGDQSPTSMPAIKNRRARSASVGRKQRLRRNRRKETEAQKQQDFIKAASRDDARVPPQNKQVTRQPSTRSQPTCRPHPPPPPPPPPPLPSTPPANVEETKVPRRHPSTPPANVEETKVPRRHPSTPPANAGETKVRRHPSTPPSNAGETRVLRRPSSPGPLRRVRSSGGRQGEKERRPSSDRPKSDRSAGGSQQEEEEISRGSQSSRGTLRRERSDRRPSSHRSSGSDEGRPASGRSIGTSSSKSPRGTMRKTRSNSRDKSQEEIRPTSSRSMSSHDEDEIGRGSHSSRGSMGQLRKARSRSRDKAQDAQGPDSQRSMGSSSEEGRSREPVSSVSALRKEMSNISRSKEQQASQHEARASRRASADNILLYEHKEEMTEAGYPKTSPEPGRRKSNSSNLPPRESSRKRLPVGRNHSSDDILLVAPEEEDNNPEPLTASPGTLKRSSALKERRAPGRSQSSQVESGSGHSLYRSPRRRAKPPVGNDQEKEKQRSPPIRSQSERTPSKSPGSLKSRTMDRHSTSRRGSQPQLPPLSPSKDDSEYRRKQDELEYKMKLFREYRQLAKEGMSDEEILGIFPEMESVIKK